MTVNPKPPSNKKRLLLFTAKLGYQTRSFEDAEGASCSRAALDSRSSIKRRTPPGGPLLLPWRFGPTGPASARLNNTKARSSTAQSPVIPAPEARAARHLHQRRHSRPALFFQISTLANVSAFRWTLRSAGLRRKARRCADQHASRDRPAPVRQMAE